MLFGLLFLLLHPPGENVIPWSFPPAPRIAAFGDVHGDLDAARRALRLAGAIDEKDRWIGGDLVVVQTGDQMDRGDEEIQIVMLFERLTKEAEAAGGAFHVLNGNHELMNVYEDYRYVTPGAYRETHKYLAAQHDAQENAGELDDEAARTKVFGPGGPIARLFAQRNTILKIGDTLFVHGGLLPDHVEMGIGEMNARIQAWCAGKEPKPDWVRTRHSPVWDRHFSLDTDAEDCKLLAQVLELTGAKRMVVGHTVQDTTNAACDGQVWRVDVGMGRHYGPAPAQVLWIEGDRLSILIERDNAKTQ